MKLLGLVALAGGVIGVAMMWTGAIRERFSANKPLQGAGCAGR